MVVPAYNSRYSGNLKRPRRILVQGQPRQKSSHKTLSQLMGAVACACHPSYGRSIKRRITIQEGPGKKRDPIPNTTKAKRIGSMAQVVACLLSKHKTLNLTSGNIQTHTHTNTKVYFDTQFWRLQFMNSWSCCFRTCGEKCGAHHGGSTC
jgi:hypothetical protein